MASVGLDDGFGIDDAVSQQMARQSLKRHLNAETMKYIVRIEMDYSIMYDATFLRVKMKNGAWSPKLKLDRWGVKSTDEFTPYSKREFDEWQAWCFMAASHYAA